MNRRSFLQGVIASAGAAAMPLPVIAKAAAQTTAKVVPFHYGWACVYAQKNNGVSAADIARVFRVSPTEADALMDRMLSRGVIRPPGLDGKAQPTRAWEPWDQKTTPAPHTPDETTAQTPRPTGTRARAKFQRSINTLKSDPAFNDAQRLSSKKWRPRQGCHLC